MMLNLISEKLLIVSPLPLGISFNFTNFSSIKRELLRKDCNRDKIKLMGQGKQNQKEKDTMMVMGIKVKAKIIIPMIVKDNKMSYKNNQKGQWCQQKLINKLKSK